MEEELGYDCKFEIPLKLPSLNDYIRECRTNKYLANSYKARIETEIGYFLTKMPRYDKSIKIHFTWVESTKKRDLDNICFAKKFILDAMVRFGKLKDDNRNCVCAFTDSFEYAKENKVIVEIVEVENENDTM